MARHTSVKSPRGKDEFIGRVIAGRYRLETRLGEGGMGVVYRARHVLIDRIVAVKLIRPDLRNETHLRAWMLREARAANRVDHAHIVEIHDVGETEDGDVYLVMEYLVGASLASEVAKGQMTIARAVDILEQMCAALARAHDLGVIHRDLKSDNIMLTTRGGRRDFVKILDFGLAALARDPRLAPKGAVFGTPEYMSPEQARGEDASALSDLYSLGVLFYEMTTGQLPFRSNDRETLLEMQRTKPASSPRLLRADLPQPAEHIILKLLEKDAKNRFRDGHHLQEELKALQRSLPLRIWENQQGEAPAMPPPPPPAQTPGVVEWSSRAANFARMVARAYPNGQAPPDVDRAAQDVWRLAASASRLEGELTSHSRRLEAIERRGRAIRAELGRKVEELAQDESRLLRAAAEDSEQERDIQRRLRGFYEQREKLAADTAMFEHMPNVPEKRMRDALQNFGAVTARIEELEAFSSKLQASAEQKTNRAKELRSQINDLRAQLLRYGEALETDLSSGRERISTRVREALDFEQKFSEASALLLEHLRTRPDCQDVLDEVTRSHPHAYPQAPSNQVREPEDDEIEPSKRLA